MSADSDEYVPTAMESIRATFVAAHTYGASSQGWAEKFFTEALTTHDAALTEKVRQETLEDVAEVIGSNARNHYGRPGWSAINGFAADLHAAIRTLTANPRGRNNP